MNISALAYFRAMADQGRIKNISEELHISPQALSASILSLEQELGFELFSRRKGQKNQLNAYGISFLEDAEEILSVYHRALEKLQAIRQWEEGIISIACTGFTFPNRTLSAFIMEHPQFQLSRQLVYYDKLKDFFEDNRIELIFSSVPEEHPDWESAELWHEPSYAAVFVGNPLSGRSSLHMEELKHEKFVLSLENHYWHHSVRDFCEKAGFEPVVEAEAFTAQYMSYIRQNCVAIVSRTTTELMVFHHTLCKLIPICDDFCARRIRLMKRRKRRLSPAANEFWNFAVKHSYRLHNTETTETVTVQRPPEQLPETT